MTAETEKAFREPALTKALMLLQSTDDIRVLLVEGGGDKTCFDRATNDTVETINAENRDNVIERSNFFQKDYPQRIKGICDRDFLALGVGSHIGGSILHTDFHDIEIDTFEYGNFSDYVSQCVSETQMKKHGKSVKDLVELSKAIAMILGALRYVNESDSLQIDFNTVKLSSRKVLSGFNVVEAEVLNSVLNRNENSHVRTKRVEIEKKVADTLKQRHDWRQLVVGEDLLRSLAMLLNIFKRSNASNLTHEDLKNVLFGTFNRDSLLKSALGQQLDKDGYL